MNEAKLDAICDALKRADARGISSNMGMRAELALRKQKDPLSQEQHQAELTKLQAEYKALEAEGNAKKDPRGAFPKDIIRKLDKLREKIDGHKLALK